MSRVRGHWNLPTVQGSESASRLSAATGTVIQPVRLIRAIVISAIPVIFVSAISPLGAHGGGLDSCGGHNDRKNGGYHVHNQTQYCACHPDSSGCGGRTSPAPAPTPSPAVPDSAHGLAAVPSEATATATVYVTASGTKYHREGCRYLTASTRATTLADAAKSKTPCSVCKPPTLDSSALGATPVPLKSTTGTAPSPSPLPLAGSQCAATTQKGTRCKRTASAGSRYCWQHAR